MEHKPYFLDLDLNDWEKWVQERGFPKFRGQQIHEWIFKKFAVSIEEFTNIPKDLKELLSQSFDFFLPEIDTALKSVDQSVKFLLKTPDLFFNEDMIERRSLVEASEKSRFLNSSRAL